MSKETEFSLEDILREFGSGTTEPAEKMPEPAPEPKTPAEPPEIPEKASILLPQRVKSKTLGSFTTIVCIKRGWLTFWALIKDHRPLLSTPSKGNHSIPVTSRLFHYFKT